MATALQSRQVNYGALIERAQQGDAAAFEELYFLNRRKAYAICFKMVKNREDAEDLTQEAFIQLFRKIGTFRGEAKFTTWFHRVVLNVVLAKLRRKRYEHLPLDELIETQDAQFAWQIGTIDNHLKLSLERIALERAIERLPTGYQLIFVMHDIEGFEHDEIARILGCTIGTSKSRLHRSRRALLTLLHVKTGPLSPSADFDGFLSDKN